MQQRPAQRRTAKGRKRLANAAKSVGETHVKRAAKRSTAAAGKRLATALPERAAAAAKNEAKGEAKAQAKIAATRRNCTRQQPGCFAVERAPAGEAGNGKRTRLSGGRVPGFWCSVGAAHNTPPLLTRRKCLPWAWGLRRVGLYPGCCVFIQYPVKRRPRPGTYGSKPGGGR